MSSAPKHKKRTASSGAKHSSKSKTSNREPSEQDLVSFHGLLREKNPAAVTAHKEFSVSQDKTKFYQDIIDICSGSSSARHVTETDNNVKKQDSKSNSSSKKKTPGIRKKDNASINEAKIEVISEKPSKDGERSGDDATNARAQKKKKPKVCSFFSTNGNCIKGDKCRFLHPDGDIVDKCVTPSSCDTDETSNVSSNPNIPLSTTVTSTVDEVNTGAKSSAITTISTTANANVTRSEIPRTNSVDNAMGLMEMDMKFLEDNLDMRLEDQSPTSQIQSRQLPQPEEEYSQLFRDLIAGRLESDNKVNGEDVEWMSLNNTERTDASAPPKSKPLPISPPQKSPQLKAIQPLPALIPPTNVNPSSPGRGTYSAFGGTGASASDLSGQVNSVFDEVISDVIDEVSNSFHRQHLERSQPMSPSHTPPQSQSQGISNADGMRGVLGETQHQQLQQERMALQYQQQLSEQQERFHQNGRAPGYQHQNIAGNGIPPGMPSPYLPQHGMPHLPNQQTFAGRAYQEQTPQQQQPSTSPRGGVESHRENRPDRELHTQKRNGPESLNEQFPISPHGPGGYGYGGPSGLPFMPTPPPPHPMYGYGPPGMFPPGMMPPPTPQQMQQHMQQQHMHQQHMHQQHMQQQHMQQQHMHQQHMHQQHMQQQMHEHRVQQPHQEAQQGYQPQDPQKRIPQQQDVVPQSEHDRNNEGELQETKHNSVAKNASNGNVNEAQVKREAPLPDNTTSMDREIMVPVPEVSETQEQTSEPADHAKSRQLLSFLKSNVKTDLPSVMAVKFKTSPTAGDSRHQNSTTTAVLDETSKKLNEEIRNETKKVEHYRTTKNPKGRVRITKPAAGPLTAHGSCHSIQPGGHLSLSWEIASEVFTTAPKSQIVMALTRLGTMNNANNIIAKALKGNKSNHNEVVSGNIAFHAPKAAGYYVFRIFDQTDDESKAQTIATSPVFAVELRGRDVTTNLIFIFNAFSNATKQSKVDNGAINGLKNVFELMRTTGAIVNKESPPQQLLQDCVQLLLNMMSQQMDMFDIQAELVASQHEADENPDDVKAPSTMGTNEVWQKIRTAQKMHMTTYDCLAALRANKIAMGMLSAPQRAGVHSVIGLYCPLLGRFFKNFTELQKACTKEIGFEPAPLDPSIRALCQHGDKRLGERSRAMLDDLTRSVGQVAAQLIPPPSFATEREDIRLRLQQVIRMSGVVPSTCSLVLFGSSKNNFGAVGADLDMCLQYSRGEVLPTGEERGQVIEALGEVLAKEGMLDVQARSTARIPILLFKDCVSGIDCDISFNNPLAICNTNLLATYSRTDDRVRTLAFAIKHWARRREINSPQNGTLSSYGYLLCLIHFLQSRDLVPDLQSLPPSWDPHNYQVDAPPTRMELHPVENIPCNTYFYDASRIQNGVQKLKKFSSHNKESLGELLMEFFRYFAYDFDYRKDIVSIRRLHGNTAISKLSKMESSCWGSHERLSVEDPFETWYDVAHVLKSTQMTYIRAEFLRAYSLLYNAVVLESDDLDGGDLFARMCSPPEVAPKFVLKQQQAAERRSRSNTITSES